MGAIYRVEQRHRYVENEDREIAADENAYIAYVEKGTVVSIFFVEVYKNTYIDCNDGIKPYLIKFEF